MDDSGKRKKVILKVGPPEKPYAKIILAERRAKSKDRRKLYTYIADDRRNGIADRRKRKN